MYQKYEAKLRTPSAGHVHVVLNPGRSMPRYATPCKQHDGIPMSVLTLKTGPYFFLYSGNITMEPFAMISGRFPTIGIPKGPGMFLYFHLFAREKTQAKITPNIPTYTHIISSKDVQGPIFDKETAAYYKKTWRALSLAKERQRACTGYCQSCYNRVEGYQEKLEAPTPGDNTLASVVSTAGNMRYLCQP